MCAMHGREVDVACFDVRQSKGSQFQMPSGYQKAREFPKPTHHGHRSSNVREQRRKDLLMYIDIYIYRIAKDLWRWEIRYDEALVRCGTAGSDVTAEREADEETAALISGGTL